MTDRTPSEEELKNADTVQAILLEIPDLIVRRDQPDIFSVEDPETGIILIIDAEPHVISIFADVAQVPNKGREPFYERLLTLNGQTVHGAFYTDQGHVFIMENLEAENLDANELIAAIKSMMLAIVQLDNALAGSSAA